MIFSQVPVYTKGMSVESFMSQVSKFLGDVDTSLRFLELSRLHGDSFVSDEVTIAAGSEVLITNKVTGVLMSYMIPVSLSNANAILTKGPTDWTTQTLSIKNQGSGSVVARILFFK